ncbi:MAG: double-strand break repair protein AddB, partial [Pseudomonadota bacterium]|nr:double-strand break repair protein AddB [Pseudomonadota bacterium]
MNLPLHCRSIPAGEPFVNVLAGWMLERYGSDALTLARALVLLPGHRACRALREAFLDITGGKAMLLPRIRPIGEAEDDTGAAYLSRDLETVPPPVIPLRRELLLTKLVLATQPHCPVGQAAELARGLARFIDEAAREKLDLGRLSTLAPEELATHWQQTLDF